jgi:anti-sigma regulatory factor (Ser/Thr protein kinase)
LELDLSRSPTAPGVARDQVERVFRGSASDRAVDDLKLVVSELITNAIVHGAGPVSLTARTIVGTGIHIEVTDAGTRSSPAVPVPPRPTGGLGLRLVDALAASWGVRVGRSCVWADMPVV